MQRVAEFTEQNLELALSHLYDACASDSSTHCRNGAETLNH
jgi:hypothetical protein